MKVFLFITLMLTAASTMLQARATGQDASLPQVEYVAAQGLPFSDVVQVGNMLYLSGQIGFDNKLDGLVAGGITAETQKTMENIKQLLIARGSSMDKIIRCTVMLADMGDFAKMNSIYVSFFDKHYPARSTFGVNGLALDAKVEIECSATL